MAFQADRIERPKTYVEQNYSNAGNVFLFAGLAAAMFVSLVIFQTIKLFTRRSTGIDTALNPEAT